MFLVKSLDDLLKVSGATLEGTVPRVAQLEADEQDLSNTRLDVAVINKKQNELEDRKISNHLFCETTIYDKVYRKFSCWALTLYEIIKDRFSEILFLLRFQRINEMTCT